MRDKSHNSILMFTKIDIYSYVHLGKDKSTHVLHFYPAKLKIKDFDIHLFSDKGDPMVYLISACMDKFGKIRTFFLVADILTVQLGSLREGFQKKKPANYPHFVDKGGGSPQMWISDWGGSSDVDKKIP